MVPEHYMSCVVLSDGFGHFGILRVLQMLFVYYDRNDSRSQRLILQKMSRVLFFLGSAFEIEQSPTESFVDVTTSQGFLPS